MIKTFTTYFSFFLFFSVNSFAQSTSDTLELPFFDDFYYAQYQTDPSAKHWLDNHAKVNCDYPVSAPTIGVVVFDGLNRFGTPYSNTNESRACDTLTSKPINLNYPAGDSIYLSFLFQAKGWGNYPEIEDSIRLEFKAVGDSVWTYAWSRKGEIFPQTAQPFKAVMVPIRDSVFLKKGFQFRFRNYASGNASSDHWLIDYIKIDRFRNRGDSLFDDIAFNARPFSWLKDYQSIPWKHYITNRPSYMAETFEVKVKNMRGGMGNPSYRYETFNQNNTLRDNLLFEPVSTMAPQSESTVVKPVKYVFEELPVPFAYYITWHQLENSGENPTNDSLLYFQHFSNYYALDDGTAEERVSLINGNAGGFVAQRFNINVADTIRSVQLSFNRERDGVNTKPFFIAIWNSKPNGTPDQLINFQLEAYPTEVVPENSWFTYKLVTPQPIQPGNYFIGWIQEVPFRMNIGFDRNINNNSRIFVNTNGNWSNNSGLDGTLMIRMLVGSQADTIIQTISDIDKSTQVKFWPNPVKDFLFFDTMGGTNFNLEIFSITGQKVMSQSVKNSSNPINVTELKDGLYILRLTVNQRTITHKFIKANGDFY